VAFHVATFLVLGTFPVDGPPRDKPELVEVRLVEQPPEPEPAPVLPEPEVAAPEPELVKPKPVPVEDVIGSWTASGKGTGQYSMTLTKEGTFTWSFSRGTRKQAVKGVYAVEGNVLAMEPETGGVMLAELTGSAPDSLHFQMVGGQKGDPGLGFTRSKD
jgi:hypothetical protein